MNKTMNDNPANSPNNQPTDNDDNPKFGRLLIVLFIAVLLIALLTFASEAMYS